MGLRRTPVPLLPQGGLEGLFLGNTHPELTARRGTYRVVVVRKNLSVERGEHVPFDDVRYFFYLTNDPLSEACQIVFEANDRCNQENLLAQLKSGVRALHAPVDTLVSNWAYMVMASLAWTLKAWFALRLPAQILRQGRKTIYRLLGWNRWLPVFFRGWEQARVPLRC